MRTIALGTAGGRRRRAARRVWPSRAIAVLREWRSRNRGRAQLAKLDDRLLRDIGLTRADVWLELNKPFWRE